ERCGRDDAREVDRAQEGPAHERDERSPKREDRGDEEGDRRRDVVGLDRAALAIRDECVEREYDGRYKKRHGGYRHAKSIHSRIVWRMAGVSTWRTGRYRKVSATAERYCSRARAVSFDEWDRASLRRFWS